MPSKALLRAGEVLEEARRVPGVREAVTGALDVEAVLRRRDALVNDLHDDHQGAVAGRPGHRALPRPRTPHRRTTRAGR